MDGWMDGWVDGLKNDGCRCQQSSHTNLLTMACTYVDTTVSPDKPPAPTKGKIIHSGHACQSYNIIIARDTTVLLAAVSKHHCALGPLTLQPYCD